MDDELIPLDDFRRNAALVKHLDLIDPIRWQDAQIPRRRWIVDGPIGIPDRNVTLFPADGGIGKTLTELQLAVASALGRQWLGMPTKQVKALCVLCEDEPDEIHRRLAAILSHYQADFGDLENLAILSRVGLDNSLMTWSSAWEPGEVTAFYLRILNLATDGGYQLIILDSLHDFFTGNENSRPHARQFIQALHTIATEADGAVIVSAHPSLSGRNSGTGEAGSTAWNNAVRSRIYMTRPDTSEGELEDIDARVLTTKKSNYGPVGGSIPLRWKDGVFVRDDGVGDTVDNIMRSQTDRDFLSALDVLAAQGTYVTDAKNSPRYAPKVMTERLKIGHSRRALTDAMNSMFNAKIIVNGAVRTPDRHTATAIILASQNDTNEVREVRDVPR